MKILRDLIKRSPLSSQSPVSCVLGIWKKSMNVSNMSNNSFKEPDKYKKLISIFA